MSVPADHNRYLPTSIPAFSYTDGLDRWKACCPSLELCALAETEDEAIGALNASVARFLRNALEQGTLELELLRMGWTLACGSYLPPSVSRAESCAVPVEINKLSIVPIPIVNVVHTVI